MTMKVCSGNIDRKQMRNKLLNREKQLKGPWKEYDETTLWLYSYREVVHTFRSSRHSHLVRVMVLDNVPSAEHQQPPVHVNVKVKVSWVHAGVQWMFEYPHPPVWPVRLT